MTRARTGALALLVALASGWLDSSPVAAIAFAGNESGSWQIWVADDDGGNPRRVTDGPLDKRLPLWIDRNTLLYESNRGEVFQVDLTSGVSRRILEGAGSLNGCDLDGTALVCVRIRGDSRDVSEILVVDLTRSGTRTISRKVGRYRSPRWIEGGKAILYSFKAGPEPETIHRLEVDSMADIEVVGGPEDAVYPAISPDGRTLLYAATEAGDLEIMTLEPGTGNRRRLTRSPSLDTQPRFMGDRILFVSARGGDPALWTMSRDGGNPKRLTNIPSKDPSWIEAP